MRWICLAAVVAAGCGSEDEPDTLCDELVSSGNVVDSGVTLGLGDPDTFEPIADGDELELELGTQGGWMVRPVARLDAAALGAGPDRCVWVETVAAIEGSADPVSLTQVPTFDYNRANVLSSPLLVLLSFDLEAVDGRQATIDVRIEGPDAASTASIDVELVNLE